MRTRPFPALHCEVSEVGLGCWQLGAEWGEVSDAQARAVLQAATDAGITFFDTADVYGRGRSEQRLRQFLAAPRRPVIATKVGRFPDPGLPGNLAFEVMRKHVLAARERLGVPILDLVQLHCVPPAALFAGAVFDHLRRLRDDGVLRAWGASVESVAEAERCLQESDCASLQLIFSLLRQTPAVSGLLDRAHARGVAILVRLPLASGLLAGNWRPDTKFAADDHRTFNRDGAAFHVGETFAGLPWERALAVVAAVRPCLPAAVPMATAALRWVLDHPAVTTVIPGATKPAQVQGNAAASAMPPLGDACHARLREFWRTQVQPFVRGND